MRLSDLALIMIRLKINAEPFHVLIRHKKWNDWSFVGGHVEPHEKNEWARAAVRECNEELAPLKYSEDFTLLPLLDQPLRWGPINSLSAGGELTMYTAQFFALRFLRPPAECLAKLSVENFRLVRESELVSMRRDSETLTARAINRVDRSAVAWDWSLSSLPLPTQSLSA
jgi:ADP-ribose pyrophosphatase YjhB (NUDIX family)